MSNSENESEPQANDVDRRPPIKLEAPSYEWIEKSHDESGLETRGPNDDTESK